jgi:fructose-1,6-bisphosphatase/inositol monophosphatase family enzyme
MELLRAAGVSILSEESGWHPGTDPSVTVVVDPVDGSTNAAHGIPWYATSLCAVDDDGPRVALVVNQATGQTFSAARGAGAFCDGEAIAPSGCRSLGDAVVGLSGFPTERLGWRQYRALGAAALDLCLVASGGFDAYVDCSRDAHGPWDYLGGLLVCLEAGAVVTEVEGRDLVALGHGDRRTPLAAATPELCAELLARRTR